MRGTGILPTEIPPIDLSARQIRVTFKVVTPVHGGGVGWDPSEEKRHIRPIDPVTPIRVSAIRGQLRFWWRAAFGCTMGSVEAMKAAEDNLWGNASQPGLVNLALEKWALRTEEKSLAEFGSGIQYAAFTLKNNNNWGTVTNVMESSTLVLTCNPAAPLEQISKTVALWSSLGGVGGRNRRGFGAVVGINQEVQQLLTGFASMTTADSQLLNLVPTLHKCKPVFSNRTFECADTALNNGLDLLRRFRQGVGVGEGRNQGNGHPGRSRWPDVDTIRRKSNIWTTQHSPRQGLGFPDGAVPRAAFGMPILFHFTNPNDGPDGKSVVPDGKERMASSLWIRPVADGDRFRVLALLLHIPGLKTRLYDLKFSGHRVTAVLDDSNLSYVQPLADNGALQPLPAFLNFFQRNLR